MNTTTTLTIVMFVRSVDSNSSTVCMPNFNEV